MEKIKKNKLKQIEKNLSISWDEDEDVEWEAGDFWDKAGLFIFGDSSKRNKRDTNVRKEQASKNIGIVIHKILQQYIYCKRDRTEVKKVEKSNGNYIYSVPDKLIVKVLINQRDELKYEKIMKLPEVRNLLSSRYFSETEYKRIVDLIERKIEKL